MQRFDISSDCSDAATNAAKRASRYAGAGFVLAAILVTIFFIGMLQQPISSLLGIVPDDAFYYLGTARHLALTGHSTFDGVNVTNGYHPAWMAIVTLMAWLLPDRVDLLYGVLALCLLLHIATASVIVVVFTSLLGSFRGWIGGICWLLNPFALLLALQAVETSLYLLALALLTLVYLIYIDPHPASDNDSATARRHLILFGSMIGLAFLARTDAIILAVIVMAYLGIRSVTLTRRGRRLAVASRTLGIVAGSALAVVLPWFLYSYSVVGTIAQDSGVMKALWASDSAVPSSWTRDPAGSLTFFRWHWFGDSLARMLLLPMQWKAPLAVGFVLLLGGAIYTQSRSSYDTSFRRMLRLTLWLGAATAATGVAYALFIEDVQIWHKGEPALILFMLGFGWGALVLSRILSRASQTICFISGGMVVVLALTIFLHFRRNLDPLYPWQSRMYTSQPRFHARVPDGSIIGCLNSGIPGYFGSQRVVNIDGLVNHIAVEYWRRHEFERLIRDQHIDYILDVRRSLERAERFSLTALPLTPIDSVVLMEEWPNFKYYLWKVDND